MKLYLPIFFWLVPAVVFAQVNDSLQKTVVSKSEPAKTSNGTTGTSTDALYKPEIFTSGFIDIINNGQVNASARFIRLFIGEPGKFSIPLSVYSGVSSNSFQNTQASGSPRSNDALVNNFINPLSGLANISIDGVFFLKIRNFKTTRLGVLYHAGERVLTGIRVGPVNDPATGKPVNFLNSFGTLGLYFQTGAWERSNTKNIGVFWFAARAIGCYTSPGQLREIFPGLHTDGFYSGYSLAWGVEINHLVNIKVVYYKYTRKPEIDYYLPIYQFSFNYLLKK